MEVPQTLVKILVLVVPGLIALAGNVIFYWVIKGKVDKSVEKHKIGYSGVFKERIEIYRELLKHTFEKKVLSKNISMWEMNFWEARSWRSLIY